MYLESVFVDGKNLSSCPVYCENVEGINMTSMGRILLWDLLPSESPPKSMSPTPTNRSRGHRSVGVGDSD